MKSDSSIQYTPSPVNIIICGASYKTCLESPFRLEKKMLHSIFGSSPTYFNQYLMCTVRLHLHVHVVYAYNVMKVYGYMYCKSTRTSTRTHFLAKPLFCLDICVFLNSWLGNKTVISCLILGNSHCCPTVVMKTWRPRTAVFRVFSTTSEQQFWLFPSYAWNNCIISLTERLRRKIIYVCL
jgi:hypothetical protein